MNVVFIVVDCLRRDRLSIYNDDIDFTGNIEALADDSRVYEQAISQAPWTLPSHASFFTGQYPWEHGATQRNPRLETDRELLAEKFRNQGYRTTSISFNGFLNPHYGLLDGFQEVENFTRGLESLVPDSLMKKWDSFLTGDSFDRTKSLIQKAGLKVFHSRFSETSNPEKVIERSREFIDDSLSEGDSFFLFVNLMSVHEPYYPSEEYLEKHAPENDTSGICQNPIDHLFEEGETDFESLKKVYDAAVDETDDYIGDLIGFLDRKDLLDETVIVLTSDHGQLLGEEDLFGHQLSVAEELVHVPLIISSPGLETDRQKDLMELRQLYSLLPDLAGVEENEIEKLDRTRGGYEYPDMFIKSLPREIREEYYRRLRFIRDEERKLVEVADDGEKSYTMMELDSMEVTETDSKWREEIRGIDDADSETDFEHEEEVKERLEDLGYV